MFSEKSENLLLEQKDFKDFCNLPINLLKSLGYNLDKKIKNKWLDIAMKCFSLMEIFSHSYVFTHVAKFIVTMLISGEIELALMLRLLSGLSYSVFSTMKFLAFFSHLTQFRQIYKTLEEIYPKTRKEKIVYRVHLHFWPKWILTILYFYMGATAFIVISPLMEGIIGFAVDIFKVGLTEAKFAYHKLYEIDYSFDHHNPLAYIVTYAIEIMHAHLIILFNIVGDILLLCFCLQMCMHFDFISRKLENHEPDEQAAEKDQQFIADVVKRHQILLNISNDMNGSFGVLLLLLLMYTAATLCCAAVYAITQGLGREFIEYVAFLPTVVGQYFLICYYGQQLIIKSQCVGDAAYNNSWYNGSKSFKKSIFIILMRSQKGAEINAYGYQSICLEAFKMVMGVTYRAFAVLKETML